MPVDLQLLHTPAGERHRHQVTDLHAESVAIVCVERDALWAPASVADPSVQPGPAPASIDGTVDTGDAQRHRSDRDPADLPPADRADLGQRRTGRPAARSRQAAAGERAGVDHQVGAHEPTDVAVDRAGERREEDRQTRPRLRSPAAARPWSPRCGNGCAPRRGHRSADIAAGRVGTIRIPAATAYDSTVGSSDSAPITIASTAAMPSATQRCDVAQHHQTRQQHDATDPDAAACSAIRSDDRARARRPASRPRPRSVAPDTPGSPARPRRTRSRHARSALRRPGPGPRSPNRPPGSTSRARPRRPRSPGRAAAPAARPAARRPQPAQRPRSAPRSSSCRWCAPTRRSPAKVRRRSAYSSVSELATVTMPTTSASAANPMISTRMSGEAAGEALLAVLCAGRAVDDLGTGGSSACTAVATGVDVRTVGHSRIATRLSLSGVSNSRRASSVVNSASDDPPAGSPWSVVTTPDDLVAPRGPPCRPPPTWITDRRPPPPRPTARR